VAGRTASGEPAKVPLFILDYHVLEKLLDIGVINVETCEPLPNVLVDIWQANATGHYAGES